MNRTERIGPRERARFLRWLAAALATVLATTLGLPTVAAADDGLDETSHSRYVVKDGAKAVKARVTLTLRNTIPDRRMPDGSIRYYYSDRYQLQVPASVKKVTATSDGTTLRTSFRPSSDASVRLVQVSFPQLRYGRTRKIVFDFDIPGSPIRSKDYTRVGDGYAAFAVESWGDRGQVSVEIVLPKRMEFNSTAEGFTATTKGEQVTWRITEHTQAEGIWSFVSARDASRVGEHKVTIGDDTVALLSFPGDDAWAEFIAEQTTKGVPALEALIGQKWPGGLNRIREDVAPSVSGYAWFDHGRREIVLGEELDTALLYHELTHAWLSSEQITGRWLYEGLTELVARRAVERTGGESEPRKAPKRKAKVAFPLLEWAEGLKAHADDAEQYGYDASYTAAHQLLGELDDATLAALLIAVYVGESAYDAPGRAEPTRYTDWRRFLDLVEDRAGVADAAKIYRTWVVDEQRAKQLDERDPARESYRALDVADGGWLPPQGLRKAMAEWRFDDAHTTIDTLAGTAATAGQLQQATQEAGLAQPDWLRETWEQAATPEDYTALTTTVPRALAVTGTVSEASEAARSATGPIAELGKLLLSVDVTAEGARTYLSTGELDGAESWAQTALERTRLAPWVGIATIAGAVLLLAGGMALVLILRRRARNRLPVAVPLPDAPYPPPSGVPSHTGVVHPGCVPGPPEHQEPGSHSG